MSHENLIELADIRKSFQIGGQAVEIVKGVSFRINRGDFLIIFGPSGCGKSTTLHIILGLEPPTSGKVTFLGKDLYSFDADQRAAIRKKHVGMVYQQANWVKSLNVLDNVAFPLMLMGVGKAERDRKAWEMLKMVEMKQGADQYPTELSSGQQQRIALARAIISDPEVIIADEPTGNLDSKASEEMMKLFKKFNDDGRTIIMVTHDLEYLKYATRTVNIIDGKVAGEYKQGDKALKQKMVSKRGSTSSTIAQDPETAATTAGSTRSKRQTQTKSRARQVKKVKKQKK